MNRKISPWLDSSSLRPDVALRLFCFPYAGGSGSIYRDWQSAFPLSVEICPIQLTGRGARLREPLMKRVDSVVKALLRELRPYMDRPFAFFGYSMGAVLSFELARALRDDLAQQPVQLFVSGRRAPDIPMEGPVDYDLPDADLVARLRQLDGTPQEILDNREVLELLLPMVRADFEIVQTYKYVVRPPLQCPIDAFAGVDDTGATPEHMEGWKNQTKRAFSLSVIPGEHFFLLQTREQFLKLLVAKVNEVVMRLQVRQAAAIR